MEERLQKVLARAGVASRRQAEQLILDGRVTVNGKVVRELGVKVDASIDEVRVDTVEVARAAVAGDEPRAYVLLNKPKGVICTSKDTHGRPTVLDMVPPRPGKRLWPVGRLDEDSEGIVLLTDDGELTDRLTHPRFGVPKTYDVRVKGHLTRENADEFEKGVWLSEGRTGQSRVRIRHAGREISHVHVTLTEGKNREIRRAFAKLEFPVISIKRIQIGPIVARGLPVGAFRVLEKAEVDELKAAAQGQSDNMPLRGHRLRAAQKGRKHRPGKPDPALAPRHDAAPEGRTPRGGRSGRGAPRPGGRPPRDGGRPGGKRDGRSGRPGGGRPGSGRSPREGGRPSGGRPGGPRPGGGRSGGGPRRPR